MSCQDENVCLYKVGTYSNSANFLTSCRFHHFTRLCVSSSPSSLSPSFLPLLSPPPLSLLAHTHPLSTPTPCNSYHCHRNILPGDTSPHAHTTLGRSSFQPRPAVPGQPHLPAQAVREPGTIGKGVYFLAESQGRGRCPRQLCNH